MEELDHERLSRRLDKLEHRLNAIAEYVLIAWLLGGSAIILYLGRQFGLAGTLIAAGILAMIWYFTLRTLRRNLGK
jgi:hypothetical protein